MNSMLKTNSASYLVLIALAFLSSCAGELAATNSNSKTNKTVSSSASKVKTEIEEIAKAFKVSEYSSGQFALTQGTFTSSEADFLQKVSSAEITINSAEVQLNFYDSLTNPLTPPLSFAGRSSFKDLGEFLLINISNGSAQGSIVIHKDSREVFVSHNTNLVGILPNTTVGAVSVSTPSGQQTAVKVKALKTNGEEVNVGLVVVNGNLIASKVN